MIRMRITGRFFLSGPLPMSLGFWVGRLQTLYNQPLNLALATAQCLEHVRKHIEIPQSRANYQQ